MRAIAFLALLLLPGLAAAQRVLDLHTDGLAFSRDEASAFAAHAYGARLMALREAGELDPDPALKARLQRLLPRLLAAAAYEQPQAASLAWEVHTCARCSENASALPGGKILVSSDFVRRLGLSDDELAYLLAHEIGHVLAQHTREFVTVARYFVDNGLARDYADLQHELGESLGVALRMRPLYAQQELEADRIGFVLGAHARFAPEAMPSLLGKLEGGRGFLGTHPGQGERLRQARAMMETARRLAAAGL